VQTECKGVYGKMGREEAGDGHVVQGVDVGPRSLDSPGWWPPFGSKVHFSKDENMAGSHSLPRSHGIKTSPH
jgi:hypothetical protein